MTPVESGVTFSPSNQPVAINGANQSGVNFTAQQVTYAVSGILSPASVGSGATVTLGGASPATTTADSNGNYSFTGLSNGSYTVTPTKSGVIFSPSNQPVAINGANQSGINFTAQIVAQGNVQLIQKAVNGNDGTTASMSVAFPTANTAGNFLNVEATVARPAGHADYRGLAGKHLHSRRRANNRRKSKCNVLSLVCRKLQSWNQHGDCDSWHSLGHKRFIILSGPVYPLRILSMSLSPTQALGLPSRAAPLPTI